MKGATLTLRSDTLAAMVEAMRHDLDGITPLLALADPTVERDLHLAEESIDHAACCLRRLRHAGMHPLFESEQTGGFPTDAKEAK